MANLINLYLDRQQVYELCRDYLPDEEEPIIITTENRNIYGAVYCQGYKWVILNQNGGAINEFDEDYDEINNRLPRN